MVITNGLPGKYTAVQMHLHWGGWDLEASGAEHTLDGIRYMAEVGLKSPQAVRCSTARPSKCIHARSN